MRKTQAEGGDQASSACSRCRIFGVSAGLVWRALSASSCRSRTAKRRRIRRTNRFHPAFLQTQAGLNRLIAASTSPPSRQGQATPGRSAKPSLYSAPRKSHHPLHHRLRPGAIKRRVRRQGQVRRFVQERRPSASSLSIETTTRPPPRFAPIFPVRHSFAR